MGRIESRIIKTEILVIVVLSVNIFILRFELNLPLFVHFPLWCRSTGISPSLRLMMEIILFYSERALQGHIPKSR